MTMSLTTKMALAMTTEKAVMIMIITVIMIITAMIIILTMWTSNYSQNCTLKFSKLFIICSFPESFKLFAVTVCTDRGECHREQTYHKNISIIFLLRPFFFHLQPKYSSMFSSFEVHDFDPNWLWVLEEITAQVRHTSTARFIVWSIIIIHI